MQVKAVKGSIQGALVICTIALGIGFPLQGWTQPNSSPISRVTYARPPLPPGTPPKGRAKGGADRGECITAKTPLTALVPTWEQSVTVSPTRTVKVTNVWGQTVASHPTIWFYVPYTSRSEYPAEFILQDSDNNNLYKTAIPLPANPGVIGVRLPTNEPGLEPGKAYRWYFKVFCSLQRSQPSISVEGWVQRIGLAAGLKQKLEAAMPPQKAALYAANGIWYDALSAIADLRLKDPKNPALANDWTSLLQALEADKTLASEPLVKSVK